MSKAILMSMQPKWCELIASGKKTVEVRKTKPKLDVPFKVYIYCTRYEKGKLIWKQSNKFLGYKLTDVSGKIIGEFVCYQVDRIVHCGTCNRDIRLNLVDKNLYCKELDYEYLNKCKLSYFDIYEYSNGGDVYGWHISNLKIYDKPKELREFINNSSVLTFNDNGKLVYSGMNRPPQSWCYVEELEDI